MKTRRGGFFWGLVRLIFAIGGFVLTLGALYVFVPIVLGLVVMVGILASAVFNSGKR